MMSSDETYPTRKRNRLEQYDYSSRGAYFITLCCENRQKLFWSGDCNEDTTPENVPLSSYGRIVNEAIANIGVAYGNWSVEYSVIMPNHVHILIFNHSLEPDSEQPSVSRIIKHLKEYVSKRIGKTVWQRSFHDHIIRNLEDFEEHVKYIHYNPVRWHFDELYSE